MRIRRRWPPFSARVWARAGAWACGRGRAALEPRGTAPLLALAFTRAPSHSHGPALARPASQDRLRAARRHRGLTLLWPAAQHARKLRRAANARGGRLRVQVPGQYAEQHGAGVNRAQARMRAPRRARLQPRVTSLATCISHAPYCNSASEVQRGAAREGARGRGAASARSAPQRGAPWRGGRGGRRATTFPSTRPVVQAPQPLPPPSPLRPPPSRATSRCRLGARARCRQPLPTRPRARRARRERPRRRGQASVRHICGPSPCRIRGRARAPAARRRPRNARGR